MSFRCLHAGVLASLVNIHTMTKVLIALHWHNSTCLTKNTNATNILKLANNRQDFLAENVWDLAQTLTAETQWPKVPHRHSAH